ncbi:MAG: ATP-binding protein [Proteobacteria bacterium]|nr:ATP-binding protein [Pseudomonadota bacterium]
MSTPPTPSPSPPTPLRIEITGGGAKFKSIGDLIWDDIPPLVVLTGTNGSGKTQLLELIAHKLTETLYQGAHDARFDSIRVTATPKIDPGSIVFVPSSWDLTPVGPLGLPELVQMKQNLWNELNQPPHQRNANMMMKVKAARVEEFLGRPIREFNPETFAAALPNNFLFMLEDQNVVVGLAHVMVAHQIRKADALLQGSDRDKLDESLGVAPWDLLNEVLAAADFTYRVVPPEPKLMEKYQLRFTDTQTGTTLNAQDLSSGEKAILRTVLWLYNSQQDGHLARLFLLDEPDAHLHPSMAQQFLSVLNDVLVNRHGIRVILTTHSPSTVALAPADSVFEMSRNEPRIRKSPSVAHSIGLLTAGLVTVSRGTRFVLVEDQADVDFYNTVHSTLTAPSMTSQAPVAAAPSLVFLPASIGDGGGVTVVTGWVNKFVDPPLSELFRGVVDRDAANQPTARIKVISRYNIENYLLDPLNVFGLLCENGTAAALLGGTRAPEQGNEHEIREYSESELQAVIAAMRALIEPKLNPIITARETDEVAVHFINGRSVKYPRWMIDRNGHGLLPQYQSILGGNKVVTPPALRRMMRRVRMIPSEFVSLMKALQE